MKNNTDAFSYIEDVTGTIIDKMFGTVIIPAKKFLMHIIPLFMGIRGRLNFLNMSRHGCFSEKSYRHQFEQEFDFLEMNTRTNQLYGSGKYIAAFDPSYISKSGKHTPHLGRFWSGSEQKSKRGLEIGVLAAIDLKHQTAFSLNVKQTPSAKELRQEQKTLVNHYAEVIINSSAAMKELKIDYLTVDGYFSKETFISPVLNTTHLQIITKARNDANFRYIYKGAQRTGKGRHREYDGKIDVKKIDKRKIKLIFEDQEKRIYSDIVYAVQLKLQVRMVYIEEIKNGKPTGSYAILISTDHNLNAMTIFKYYTLRFQIEFLIRDAKQHTGLQDCQARSENKLHFHFNTSLTAVSIAKGAIYLQDPKAADKSFSMHDINIMMFNELFLKRIFSNLDLDLNSKKIKRIYESTREFGRRAA
jgi:hypothetical protein